MIQHQNAIGQACGRQSMSNQDRGLITASGCQRTQNVSLGLRIHCTQTIVQDEELWRFNSARAIANRCR